MTRPASTDPEAEAVSTSLSNPGATPLGSDISQTSNCPSDLQVSGSRPFLWTGNAEVKAQPNGLDWTPTRTRGEVEIPAAAGGTHQQEAPCMGAKDEEKPSTEQPSIWEMRAYALSHVHADSPSRREQISTYNTHDRDSRGLDQPNLRRCRSWLGAHPPGYPSTSWRRSQSRRWSICTSGGGGYQYPTGETEVWAPTVNVSTVRRWCEDFHETKAAEWQQTVAGFGLAWKRWCFAQRRAKVWQDDLIKQATKHFWQPLSDFNYVLSVYSFLEGVRNCNMLPHLRPMYMAWRSPEQTRFHEGCDLRGEEDWSFEKSTSGHDMSRDNGCRVAASKYPLTRQQHLRVARICGDVDRQLKGLQYWLDLFRNYREVVAVASKDADFPIAAMAEHRWHLSDAARQFSSLAKTLTSQLRVSRTRLCEALGLDPEQVPGGDTASVPTMAAAKYEKAVDTRSPCQGELALPQGFGLQKASLQASRIALKANLYITLLPCKIAQRILGRMMARSTEMATLARQAGDDKAEAKMRRLHNKIRKVSERTDQEFPGFKSKMTLLDSETWAAVLNPREDMRVEIHGDISLPVETLIDMLHAPQVPASVQGGTPGGTGNLSSAGSTLSASEDSTATRASGNTVL